MSDQTPQFMADLLRKVHALQLVIAHKNDGHSLHVNLDSIFDVIDGTGYHISFDVTLFDCTSLVKSWDFSPFYDADTLNHNLEDLAFRISRL